MKRFVIVLFALLVGVSAFADTLRLTDGTVIKGTIVSQDATKVVIDSDLGRMEIPRYKVANMDFGNSAAPAAAPATAAPAAPAATPNITINQNVTQNASAGGNGGGSAISEKERKLAVLKIEQMVRSKDFLNKSKRQKMAEEAALLPYEYRALLLGKYQKTGKFGYGLANFFLLGVGSIFQGDWVGVAITYGGVIGSWLLFNASHHVEYDYYGYYYDSYDEPLATISAISMIAFDIYSWFRPGIYEDYYNKSLREGLATYYSQLPSLDMPLMASENSGIQVPIVSFEF